MLVLRDCQSRRDGGCPRCDDGCRCAGAVPCHPAGATGAERRINNAKNAVPVASETAFFYGEPVSARNRAFLAAQLRHSHSRRKRKIRTISLGCDFCRFSKSHGLCSFFIVEDYQSLIIIQVNHIDEGIHQRLPLVFLIHVEFTEPQQPSQSNFFNRLQHRWIAYRKYTVFVLDCFLDLRLCLTMVMPFFSA